jgi:hypothetical protein
MNNMRYKGKTWKVGDFVYVNEIIFYPRRFGHILKLYKEECQDPYVADVIWQNGEIYRTNLDYLELVNE